MNITARARHYIQIDEDTKNQNESKALLADAIENAGQDSIFWTYISKTPRWISWLFFVIILIGLLIWRAILKETAFIINKFSLISLILIGVVFLLSIDKCLKATSTSDKKPLNKHDELQSAPKRVHIHYFNTIKTFLAFGVITFHTLMIFADSSMSHKKTWGPRYSFTPARDSVVFQTFSVGFIYTGQSFAMSLFFFIAGYFTPSSLDRQLRRHNGTMGYWHFLQNKFKRLGCPLLASFFVLEPLRNMMAQAFVDAPLSYNPAYGVCWFLAWLLIFNTCYLFIGGDKCVWKRPRLLWMCLVCVALAPVQMAVAMMAPGQFLGMVTAHGSLPYDILFFTCGVLAQRGDWFGNPLPTVSAVVAWVLTAIMAAYYFVAAWLAVTCVDSVFRVADLQHCSHGAITTTTTTAPGSPLVDLTKIALPSPSRLAGGLLFFAVSGLAAIAISFGTLSLCQRRNRKPGSFGKQLSDAAYAAYVLHPIFITPTAYLWQLIMKASGAVIIPPINYPNPDPSLYLEKKNWNGVVDLQMSAEQEWAGFVFVLVVAQVVVWSVSIGLKNTPGLKTFI